MNLFEGTGQKIQIKDFKVGHSISGYYKVTEIDKRLKKDGKPFLSIELMDSTGKIGAKVWHEADYYYDFIQKGEIYKVEGTVNEFRDNQDLKVDNILKPDPKDQINREEFTEKAPFDTEKTFKNMIDTLNSNLNNKFLLLLVKKFVDKFQNVFKNHYGAQKIHHAHRGGLLEHTFAIIKLILRITELYDLNKEVLLIGGLFHDVGKIEEFKIEPAVSTTPSGGLIGHLILGNNIFIDMVKEIKDFPADLSLLIQHCILAHHGEKEFGSPEVPKTKEAYVLHLIDLLDSKLKIFSEILDKTTTKEHFSEYVHVLGRRLFIPS